LIVVKIRIKKNSMVYQEILFKTLTNKFWKWKMKIQPVSSIFYSLFFII